MKQLAKRFIPALILFCVVIYFAPRPLVGEDFHITLVLVGTDAADVTDQVDLDRLTALLRTGYAWHFPHIGNGSYCCRKDTVQILGYAGDPADGGRVEHRTVIFTVERCFVQDIKNRQYPIYNKEALWTEVLKLVPQDARV